MCEPFIINEQDATLQQTVVSQSGEKMSVQDPLEDSVSEKAERWAKGVDAEMRLWLDANRWKF